MPLHIAQRTETLRNKVEAKSLRIEKSFIAKGLGRYISIQPYMHTA